MPVVVAVQVYGSGVGVSVGTLEVLVAVGVGVGVSGVRVGVSVGVAVDVSVGGTGVIVGTSGLSTLTLPGVPPTPTSEIPVSSPISRFVSVISVDPLAVGSECILSTMAG